MARPSRKVMRTFARLGWLLLLAACDPNIVIGSRLPRDESEGGGGGSQAGGVAGSSAGVAGSGASAGASTGGTGDEPSAGTAGDTSSSGTAGEPSTPLFEADQEDGSLEHWDSGPDTDAGGWYGDDDSVPEYSDTGPAHSGSGAIKVTVDTAAGDRISRLYRRLTTADAYYSAWFYLAEDHTAPSWWSIFLFRAVQERAASIDLWSVNLVRRADDRLTFGVFDHAANELIQSPTEPVVEVGKWFQLQAFLHAVPGEPSKVVFYLDGVEFLALDDATAAPEGEPLYWVIGNGGSKLTPAISTVYIDDAVIDDEFVEP